MSGVYIKDLSEADIIGLKAVFRDKVTEVPDDYKLVKKPACDFCKYQISCPSPPRLFGCLSFCEKDGAT